MQITQHSMVKRRASQTSAPIKRRPNGFLKENAGHRCPVKALNTTTNKGAGKILVVALKTRSPNFLSHRWRMTPPGQRPPQDRIRNQPRLSGPIARPNHADAAGKLRPDAQARAATNRRQRYWRSTLTIDADLNRRSSWSETKQDTIAALTDDGRVQLLLIAFCFGASSREPRAAAHRWR
jgi:hypothetical protein